MFKYYFIAVSVKFKEQAYAVDESGGKVQPVLVLGKLTPTAFSIEVYNTDRSATGE